MRSIVGVVLLVVAGSATAAQTAEPEEQFATLERQWMDALAAKDEPALQALLAPEFTIVGVGSTAEDLTLDRASWLRVALARPFPRHEVSRVRVTRVGDVAVVHLVLTGVYPPKSLTPEGGTLTFLVTDVWTKREGKWQVVSRHSSLPRAR